MKKRILKIISVSLVLGTALVGCLLWYSQTSNPWDVKHIGDIDAPWGYTRVEAADGSYAEWLRQLPLKSKGSKVMLYTGGEANDQFLSAGVIDIPMLSNVEQCADMTMRLWAEYLFSRRYSDICFTDVNSCPHDGKASRRASTVCLLGHATGIPHSLLFHCIGECQNSSCRL